ncbi:MAG: hypothetical protein ACRDR6_13255 [Pseudonocardiaceae bacterium]
MARRRERFTEPDLAHQMLFGVDQVHDADRGVHHDRRQLRQPVQRLLAGSCHPQHSGHRSQPRRVTEHCSGGHRPSLAAPAQDASGQAQTPGKLDRSVVLGARDVADAILPDLSTAMCESA